MIEIVLMSYLDRLRGTGTRLFKGDARLLMGWCLAALMGHGFDMLTLPIIALFAIGEAPGWGTPMAALYGDKMSQTDQEWWQVGLLKTNAWLALTVRGLMWGAPIALLGYWDPSLYWMPLVFGIAMPLSVFITKHLDRFQSEYVEGEAWARMEYLRGLLMGSISFGVRNGL